MATALDFPALYPTGRPSFFAVKYLRHVLRRGLGYEVGSDALCVLMAVALAEDGTGYSKPVSFWNDHLGGLIGLSRNRLFAARKKLIDRGWLTYFEGARGRAPGYFVTVPGGDREVDASPLGETAADERMRQSASVVQNVTTETRRHGEEECQSNLGSSTFGVMGITAVAPNSPTERPHSSTCKTGESSSPDSDVTTKSLSRVNSLTDALSPSVPPCLRGEPNLNEPSPLLDRLQGVGVKLYEECLTKAQAAHAARGLPESRIVDVIAHIESRQITSTQPDGTTKTLQPYGGGAILFRLTKPELLSLPAGDGWPKTPCSAWSTAWAREAERRRREADRTRDTAARLQREAEQAAERERYSQLELQFAGELHRLRGDLRAVGLMLAAAGEEFEPLLPLARAKGLDSLVVRQAVLRILSR